jgi:hypothetical protein
MHREYLLQIQKLKKQRDRWKKAAKRWRDIKDFEAMMEKVKIACEFCEKLERTRAARDWALDELNALWICKNCLIVVGKENRSKCNRSISMGSRPCDKALNAARKNILPEK